MQRSVISAFLVGGFLLTFALLMSVQGRAQSAPTDESRIKEGFRIAPVVLNLKGRNRALVGMGSYLVNAVSECNDCHTRPHYLQGGNPFNGETELPNAAQHLTGGNQFGPFTSRNLTPDPITGRPAGMTFEEFLHTLRTGETDDHPGFPLQVMPWPTFRKMSDNDIRAMYEYLSAIPSRPDNPDPGPCCSDE